MKAIVDLCVVLFGLLTLFVPSRARANVSPPAPVAIVVEVNSLDLGSEAGSRLDPNLYVQMAGILESKAFAAKEPGGAPMTVRTTLAYTDEGDSNYTVHIDFIDGNGVVTPLIEGFECRACSEKRLIEQTLDGFRLSTTQLRRMLGPPIDVPPPTQLPPTPTKRVGPLGYAGIGVSSGGLLMVVAGSGLLASQSAQNPSADVVLGVGITALGLGLAAVIGDVIHRRSRSEGHRRPRIKSAPLGAGVAFSFGL
jgi:hypothetical protein